MCGNITNISMSALHSLKGTNWLFGDILNAYLNLVKQQSRLKVFTADTYVFTAFSNDNNKKNFTRNKVNPFDFDLMFIPINIMENHWALTTTFVKDKCIRYYDSLSQGNHHGLKQCKTVKEFLESNFVLNSTTSDLTQWHLENAADTPQQPDGHNCGVYVCQNAKCISRREIFSVRPSDLPAIRKEMVAELALGFLFN